VIGEWCARDPTQFALAESMTFETWRCYSLAPASVDSFRRIEGDVRSALSGPHASMSDPPRLTRAGRAFTGSDPTSDVLCRLQAPPLGSSPRGQLTARAVAGRAAFTCKPEPPYIRPVRSARSNDSERLPSCTAPTRSTRVDLSFHGAR